MKKNKVLGFTALVGDCENYLANKERATCARCGNQCKKRAIVSLTQLGMYEDVTTVVFPCAACLELTSITYKVIYDGAMKEDD